MTDRIWTALSMSFLVSLIFAILKEMVSELLLFGRRIPQLGPATIRANRRVTSGRRG